MLIMCLQRSTHGSEMFEDNEKTNKIYTDLTVLSYWLNVTDLRLKIIHIVLQKNVTVPLWNTLRCDK